MAFSIWDDYNPSQDPTVDQWGAAVDTGERGVADGIEKTAGGASFASVIAPAWHKLGTVFDRPVPTSVLLEAAGADYDVYSVPDWAVQSLPDGTERRALDPRTVKICRDDPDTGALRVIGTASPNYTIFTNRECFLDLGDAIVDLGEPNAAACGVLYDGAQAFCSWRLGRQVTVGGVDNVELWLLVHTSHDGSRPLTAAITPLRTVCQNTVRYNLRHAYSRYTLRHTRSAKLAVQQVRDTLGVGYAYVDRWEEEAAAMLNTSLTTDQFAAIIEAEFGPGDLATKRQAEVWSPKRDALVDLFATAPTQENIRGTAWAGLQAVYEFQDWSTKTPGSADPTATRFWRSLDGDRSISGPKEAITRTMRAMAGLPT